MYFLQSALQNSFTTGFTSAWYLYPRGTCILAESQTNAFKTVAIQDLAVGEQISVSAPGGSELPDTRLASDPPKPSLAELTSSERTTLEYAADEFLSSPIRIAVQNGTIVSAESDDAAINAASLIGTQYVVGDVDATDITRLLCRTVDLEMRKPDGSVAELSVIRPLWWMKATDAAVGRTIDVALHEVGISGNATILNIGACDVESRETLPGMNIVTGKIRHHNAMVWDLTFDGRSDEALGVTANHPIYSQTRQAWVPAGDLQLDEIVQTLTGTATLTARSQRASRETVFNLEVHRTHAYHVSGLGVLAHNTGLPCPTAKVPAGTRNRGPKLGQQQGRDFRVETLELYEFDPNQPRHVRGWLENERRRIAGSGGGGSTPRNPPGYVQGHGRTTPAREGFDYSNSRLQGEDLNKLEESIRRRATHP
ncbi:MAG: hypothetical protein WKF77_00455 [Planctomycetaceae bacterium]